MPVYLTVKIAPSSSAEFAASCLLTVISAVLFSSSTIRCLLFVSSALTFPVSSPPADDDLTLSDFITPFSISKFHTDESFSNPAGDTISSSVYFPSGRPTSSVASFPDVNVILSEPYVIPVDVPSFLVTSVNDFPSEFVIVSSAPATSSEPAIAFLLTDITDLFVIVIVFDVVSYVPKTSSETLFSIKPFLIVKSNVTVSYPVLLSVSV